MKRVTKTALVAVAGMVLPVISQAQSGGVAGDIKGLQAVLDTLYNQMIPQCSELIDVGRGIAGFAALWYIAARIWKHIAYAEPVDFYPLLRPFVLGALILLFPYVIAVINGVLQPSVTQTAKIVTDSDAAVAALLQEKQDKIKTTDAYQWFVGADGNGDEDKWEQYSGDASTGTFSGISNAFKFAMAKASYNFSNSIKEWMSEVLQVLYQAAALCINTIRTFNLIILAILGPVVFGLSVFDGFHHTLKAWLARYMNVFLWLPVANIFGGVISNIQVNMLKLDLAQIQARGDTFFNTTDVGYLIFLIIGIVGYFTVPSVASHIIQAGEHGALLSKTTRIASNVTNTAASGAGQLASSGASRARQGASNLYNAPGDIGAGYREGGQTGTIWGKAGAAAGRASQYMRDKLRGNKND